MITAVTRANLMFVVAYLNELGNSLDDLIEFPFWITNPLGGPYSVDSPAQPFKDLLPEAIPISRGL